MIDSPWEIDFLQYELAQEHKDAAYAEYKAAEARLENAEIRERLAEIKSQNEPLDGLLERKLPERERLYLAAHYVVCGGMLDDESA
jgi:lipid II:glycine glycyltransferase (peptidoglycan interpeptide bridge formation enzyme)